MGTNQAREERQHQRISELIPWYVNGTLEAAERQAVEAHAAVCPRCQEELAAAAQLARAIQEAESAAPSPHPAQLSRLLARIDAHEAAPVGNADASDIPGRAAEGFGSGVGGILARPRQSVWRQSRRSLAARFDFTPRRMRQLLAAELAAVLALASILAWHLRAPAVVAPNPPAAAAAEYHTLSSDAPVAVAPGTVALRVLFAEGATAARIQQILAGIRGQITAGPSPVGAYVVAVPAGPGADPADLVLAHLKAQPEVRFAERVAGAGGT
jgi:anti-sigma factor RsiW